ncbi:Cytoplasmic axial filament protein CafA and Ribonuclease G [Mucinivorans hirudinis]|uniref:Cytoplasmic axial filament protein CafA and Ribonuclease G n=1 Tax=Mucinivorans hirudinis TaxID=1433126 RepID=A0A060R7L5_9BACT|nr:Cytoplasmic axial filament protein CafA and Ribonuclease G [Mucinivorans hirudinis]
MVSKELVIHATQSEIEIALLEEGSLVEFNREKTQAGFSVGNIYLGRVKKIMAGLNAAFVDVGSEKDAFLHYLDLGQQFSTLQSMVKQCALKHRETDISSFKLHNDFRKDGKITQALATGDLVMVQIAKEPISTKGPRLTSDISLAGRHIVLVPLSNKISISQKIRSSEERKRLKRILEALLPKNFGAIVRTAAEGKSDEEIETDVKVMLGKWNTLMFTMLTATAPALLLSEASRATTILRDLLNDSFTHIHCDEEGIYHQVKSYIGQVEPESEKIVKFYKGNIPIFDQFDVTKQIKQYFGKTVVFKRGAYLIVEHTEALHVIDVNSGKRAKSDENQETNALECNLNAVPEIARQLRLKDMGGIVVIDFIDLNVAANRTLVYNAMKEAMQADRAKHNILPLTKFGLMQITRQRVRPATEIETMESCPTCRGTGTIQPSLLLDSQIESQIAYLTREKHHRFLKLHLHPYLAAYLRKGFVSKRMRWMLKYGVNLKLVPNASMGMVDYKIYNGFGDTV